MKASLKFREEEKPPLLRVKVPLNILGFPFQSGVSACGDSKDLSLNLTTFFESGPCVKLVYKPNDSWNPFSLVVKTGIGPFGSPISAPLSMSAEFNLLSRGNPSFFLRFNPQFGDFSIKKSSGSQSGKNFLLPKSSNDVIGGEKPLQNGGGGGGGGGGEKPLENGGFRLDNNGFLARVNGGSNAVSNMIDGAFNGAEMSTKTLLPIRNKAVLKFNWGVRFPEELKSDVIDGLGFRNSTGGISLSKIPFLVMNKISIEHVAGDGGLKKKKKSADVEKEAEEACFDVKRQLEVLHSENGMLRRAVDELRSEICMGNSAKSVSDYRSSSSERKASETGNLKDNEAKKASSVVSAM